MSHKSCPTCRIDLSETNFAFFSPEYNIPFYILILLRKMRLRNFPGHFSCVVSNRK